MKYFIIISFLIVSISGFAQPDPREGYPARIKTITEKLKTDSLNYSLIWERLEMKVDLMGNFPPYHEVYFFKIDSNKIKKKELYFDEFNADFAKIYNYVIKVKNFDVTEEGDFYLNRVWFYFNMLEFDKAIKDAEYLRDSASYSKYFGRGEYYNNWALFSLFTLNIINQQYDEALKAIDNMLDKKKKNDPIIYFSTHGGFLNSMDKIQLYEHFDKEDKIIPFLKQSCRENFNWYFERAKHKDADYESWSIVDNEYYTSKSSYLFYMGSAKEQSFQLLKLIIDYMQKYQDDELSKFSKVYNDIRYQVNGNYETINPDISDEKLKIMISEILE